VKNQRREEGPRAQNVSRFATSLWTPFEVLYLPQSAISASIVLGEDKSRTVSMRRIFTRSFLPLRERGKDLAATENDFLPGHFLDSRTSAAETGTSIARNANILANTGAGR
jgi:hypothetical protein